MDKRTSVEEVDEIAALVREEKDAALAAFRRGEFRDRVMRRWRKTGEAAPAKAVRPAAVAAVAAAALVVVAGFLFLVRQPRAPGPSPEFQTMASILGALPGGMTLIRQETMAPAASDLSAPSALALSVRSALAAGRSAGEKERALGHPPGPPLPATRMSLYRKMEILFKDRVIERTLLSLKDPSKEV